MVPRVIVVIVVVGLAALAFLIPKTQVVSQPQGAAPPRPAKITATTPNIQYPKPASSFRDPQPTTARSVAVIDEKTGMTLFEKESNLKHLPASTTKLMTALVTLENCSPEEVVVVNNVEKSGTQMGLETGDRITVKNLLHGLLISSGNDAAYALSQNCAASYDNFIENMNKKAQTLNLTNTHFINPAGFDDNMQYSTARDLAELARVATANPLIAEIVKIKSTVVTDVSGVRTYYLENVNKLLWTVEGVNGVKTGQTDGALEIVITKTTRNGNGVIISVLGSQDRFGESRALIEWAYSNFIWPK